MTARDLEGAVAVVTGAGRGFGMVVAERLAGAGASVCLVARTGADIEVVAARIRSHGGKAKTFAMDVTDGDAVGEAFAEIDRDLGPVSVLVNNAGTLNALGPLWETDAGLWWRDLETHLRGTLLCSHAALGRMVPRGEGRIVNVGGMLGQEGEPYSTAYTCAKAAMYRLTECLSNELTGTGVTVFCMSPGPVVTKMTRWLMESEEGRRWLPEFAALSDDEWMSPDVGAELIHRLARGDADALSGRALHVMHDLDAQIAEAGGISKDGRSVLRIIP